MSEESMPGPHLDSEELAAYLEATLPAAAQRRIEEHLAACDDCRAEAVGSYRTLRRATRGLSRRWVGVTLAAAAVAGLVLGGNALIEVSRSGQPPLRTDEAGLSFERVSSIDIVRPEDGRTVSGDSLVFIWRAQSADTFYRFTLTDEAGDVLWRTSTSDTVVVPGDDVTMGPGAYFWIVDALLAGGRTATTGARAFRVADTPSSRDGQPPS